MCPSSQPEPDMMASPRAQQAAEDLLACPAAGDAEPKHMTSPGAQQAAADLLAFLSDPKEKADEAESDDDEPQKKKKKRTSNPGVRVQGGRLYDSENGTTCHQCRQKTAETKAKCTTCTYYFCPRCLENRYNEKVDEANAAGDWSCPRCRKVCNCSNCRKKNGLAATGILAKVAKDAGFGSVSELLEKNPEAQALSMKNKEHKPAAPKKEKLPKEKKGKQPKKRKVSIQLVDDAELEPREAPLVALSGAAAAPLKLHTNATSNTITATTSPPTSPNGSGVGSAKRQRGPAWLDKAPESAPIPEDVDASQLASVLEFCSTFGPSVFDLKPSMLSLPALAAELVQPGTYKRTDLLCPVPEDSIVSTIHIKLLEIVKSAWGVLNEDLPVNYSTWQSMMRGYFAAEMISAEDAKALRNLYGPPCIAGDQMFGIWVVEDSSDSPGNNGDTKNNKGLKRERSGSVNLTTTTSDQNSPGAVLQQSPAQLAAAAINFPVEGGYWAVLPHMRVRMLYNLVHDALDTNTLRQAIEKAMEAALEAEKERRNEMAEVRKAAKEAANKQRDQELAMLVTNGEAKEMSLEEQKAVVEEAKAKAAAAEAAAAAKLKAMAHLNQPAEMRTLPLGCDRDGTTVMKPNCAAVFTGSPQGLLLLPADSPDLLAATDPSKVVAALDPRGRNESALKTAIMTACGLKAAAAGSPNKSPAKKQQQQEQEQPPVNTISPLKQQKVEKNVAKEEEHRPFSSPKAAAVVKEEEDKKPLSPANKKRPPTASPKPKTSPLKTISKTMKSPSKSTEKKKPSTTKKQLTLKQLMAGGA